jgi:glutathione S-transferase
VRGFVALERWVGDCAGSKPPDLQQTCYGSQVTLADICLVPQMYNARRFGVELQDFPRLVAICRHLETLPPFVAARPEAQGDAE